MLSPEIIEALVWLEQPKSYSSLRGSQSKVGCQASSAALELIAGGRMHQAARGQGQGHQLGSGCGRLEHPAG